MSDYLATYLCISSGCCLLHHSHHCNSCLLSVSLCSSWGRGEECETTFNSLRFGWRGQRAGGERGGLVSRTSGSHLGQRETLGSGTGRRLSMQGRKWELMCVCTSMCVCFNASLIIAAMLICAALCAFQFCLLCGCLYLPLFPSTSHADVLCVGKQLHLSLLEQYSTSFMHLQVNSQGWGMRLSTLVSIWHVTFDPSLPRPAASPMLLPKCGLWMYLTIHLVKFRIPRGPTENLSLTVTTYELAVSWWWKDLVGSRREEFDKRWEEKLQNWGWRAYETFSHLYNRINQWLSGNVSYPCAIGYVRLCCLYFVSPPRSPPVQ